MPASLFHLPPLIDNNYISGKFQSRRNLLLWHEQKCSGSFSSFWMSLWKLNSKGCWAPSSVVGLGHVFPEDLGETHGHRCQKGQQGGVAMLVAMCMTTPWKHHGTDFQVSLYTAGVYSVSQHKLKSWLLPWIQRAGAKLTQLRLSMCNHAFPGCTGVF